MILTYFSDILNILIGIATFLTLELASFEIKVVLRMIDSRFPSAIKLNCKLRISE